MINLQNIKESLIATNKYWIVFTGDSITSCEWVHPNWREIVVYVLQNEMTKVFEGDWQTPSWGIRGFNFAYDGATTKDILNKIDDLVLVKPNLVIGLMGGNDPTFDIKVKEHVKNIKDIAQRITSTGSKLVWCTSTPAGEGSKKNSEYEPYAKACIKIKENENFQIVDIYNLYKTFPLKRIYTFKSEEIPVEGIKEGDPDLQHPNQLGNAYIAKVILQEVFSVNFDPEKYIKGTLKAEKYPGY